MTTEQKDQLDRLGDKMREGVPPTIAPGGGATENPGKGHDRGRGHKDDPPGRQNPPHRSWGWRGHRAN